MGVDKPAGRGADGEATPGEVLPPVRGWSVLASLEINSTSSPSLAVSSAE